MKSVIATLVLVLSCAVLGSAKDFLVTNFDAQYINMFDHMATKNIDVEFSDSTSNYILHLNDDGRASIAVLYNEDIPKIVSNLSKFLEWYDLAMKKGAEISKNIGDIDSKMAFVDASGDSHRGQGLTTIRMRFYTVAVSNYTLVLIPMKTTAEDNEYITIEPRALIVHKSDAVLLRKIFSAEFNAKAIAAFYKKAAVDEEFK